MAEHALWRGEIRFGHETIPVKLHTAVREEGIRFHLLHKRDRVRLRQQMICALEGKPVIAEEQARGFEVEENKYILVDPEELEQAAPESDPVIAVHEFVRTGQIDPVFLDRAYYLEAAADAGGYRALVRALQELDAEGVCTWSMRKRSYLGALQAGGKVLRLHTLRHADEVLPAAALGLAALPLSEKELQIAGELVGHLTTAFDPAKFRDEHLAKLHAMIERKARGEKIPVARPRRLKPTPQSGLLKALEASLKKVA